MDAFNDNLSMYPKNLLVSYKNNSYTYAEGAFIADKIAKKLIELGINSQDCVAFLTERCEYYIFAILGIMATGAAYVPLDDAHPDDHIQFMISDTESKVVIVSDETYERADNLTDDAALLNISDIVEDEIGSLHNLSAVCGDLACLLYTSGTTGVPKGVKITRKAIINFVEFYIRDSDLNSDDVFAMYSSIGFDVGAIKSVLAPACCGACLDIIPQDIKLNINKLNEHFIENKVTHTNITTQVAKLFVENVKETSLKVLVAGGEKLGDVNAPNDYRFIDNYGPTEFCVSATNIDVCNKIDSTSIGHLLDNTKGYILDKELRRVPIGAVGELYLSGNQIADGYLNRDEETKKAFLSNPFDEGYDTMYRTGDIVRVLPDGSLAIENRRDSQIKIRGNRVELSEIESVIREKDYVDDVTVQTVKHDSNNEIVAYIVLKEGCGEDNLKESICEYVSEHKPDYMVPSFVIRLDEIPLNINGKVNKKKLPDVDFESLHVEYVAPETENERIIVEAFENVFNQKIGIYDDFIRLGGDSLTAIKIISSLNMDINPTTILRARTPYGIARSIEEDGQYGFELVKKGNKNQNMFLLPPVGGLSSIFFNFVNSIDFDGNIYVIDDFKYGLSSDEIKAIKDNDITFNHYYDAIKDIFKDGDIIVGYSLGCIYASLLCERLERNRRVAECILIDGTLEFVNNEEVSTEELIDEYCEREYNDIVNNRSSEFKDKFIEILRINSNWNFHTPKIKTHIKYITTSDIFKKDLDKISDNYEFILIDSNHNDIIQKDIDKILNYIE